MPSVLRFVSSRRRRAALHPFLPFGQPALAAHSCSSANRRYSILQRASGAPRPLHSSSDRGQTAAHSLPPPRNGRPGPSLGLGHNGWRRPRARQESKSSLSAMRRDPSESVDLPARAGRASEVNASVVGPAGHAGDRQDASECGRRGGPQSMSEHGRRSRRRGRISACPASTLRADQANSGR